MRSDHHDCSLSFLVIKQFLYRLYISGGWLSGTGKPTTTMSTTHQQVIEHFIRKDRDRAGTNLFAKDGILFSRYRSRYMLGAPYPLIVRLEDGRLLVNGNRVFWPEEQYLSDILYDVEHSGREFGVVPFDSITAAWTGARIRSWNQAPFSLSEIQHEVNLTVPSQGEKWRTVRKLNGKGEMEAKGAHIGRERGQDQESVLRLDGR